MRTLRRLARALAWVVLLLVSAVSVVFWGAVIATWIRHGCPP